MSNSCSFEANPNGGSVIVVLINFFGCVSQSVSLSVCRAKYEF